SEGGREVERVAAELKRIGKLPRSERADVALVYDYEAAWIVSIQPQGKDFSFNGIVHQWYGAARRLGLDIDVVPPGAALTGYKRVLVPCLPHVSDAAVEAFEKPAATSSTVRAPARRRATSGFPTPCRRGRSPSSCRCASPRWPRCCL